VGGQPLPQFGEERRGLPQHQGLAQVVLGAELGVQALPADAHRRRDRAHPHRGPAPVEDHLAGRVEGERAQPGPAVRPGLGAQVGGGHRARVRQFRIFDQID